MRRQVCMNCVFLRDSESIGKACQNYFKQLATPETPTYSKLDVECLPPANKYITQELYRK